MCIYENRFLYFYLSTTNHLFQFFCIAGELVEDVTLNDYEEFRDSAGHRGEAYNSSDDDDGEHEGVRQAQCHAQ